MEINTNEYTIRFDPSQTESIHIIHIATGNSIRLTPDEVFAWLNLMIKHQDEINAIRTGKKFLA